jgi:hypothetical protein
MPKRKAIDQFPENDTKSGNLIPPDDQFDSASDTGINHARSIGASSKRRYSIKSEPGDIKERMKQKLKSKSKSASQIGVRDKLKKDRSALKKRSKGRHAELF